MRDYFRIGKMLSLLAVIIYVLAQSVAGAHDHDHDHDGSYPEHECGVCLYNANSDDGADPISPSVDVYLWNPIASRVHFPSQAIAARLEVEHSRSPARAPPAA